MKRMGAIVVGIVVLGMLTGCNTLARQPKLVDAQIAPVALKPGDTAVVSVRVVDKHQIVHRIEGVVKEDPSIKFKLHDDGVAPDEKAGDHLWSLQVDVPFQAQAGNFELDLTGYRADDTPVPVRTKSGATTLKAAVPVVIQKP